MASKKKVGKKPVRKLNRYQKLRKVLNYIDNVLVSGDENLGGDLWDVLSALRGPDEFLAYNNAKDYKTVPIRSRAFPRTALKNPYNIPAVFGTLKEFPYKEGSANGASNHFNGHADRAATALKLIK